MQFHGLQSRDCRHQSEQLQVLGVGEPWPIYLEGMEECYILEPLVIQKFSHRVNLGISFLTRNNLKLFSSDDSIECGVVLSTTRLQG